MKAVFRIWLPLASTFIMMSIEMPVVAALIARLPDPGVHLAAFGVMFSILLFFEAPILMLISASNALVRERVSYERLRNFSYVTSALMSLGLFATATSPFGRLVTESLMGLEPATADWALHGALLVTPCPLAVGARRFYQGLLVQLGRSKDVANGTMVRLCAMLVVGFCLFGSGQVSGTTVGALSLCGGMVAEAIAAWLLARSAVVEFTSRPVLEAGALTYQGIVRFYTPLAITLIVNLLSHPLTSLFVAHGADSARSLAVLPVVFGLILLLRTGGFAIQEVVIAAITGNLADRAALQAFAIRLGAVLSGVCFILWATPLGYLWYRYVAGLPDDLAHFSLLPTSVMIVAPGLAVAVSYFRGLLVAERKTRTVTISSISETVVLTVMLWLLTFHTTIPGAVGSSIAVVVSNIVGITVLVAGIRACAKGGGCDEPEGVARSPA